MAAGIIITGAEAPLPEETEMRSLKMAMLLALVGAALTGCVFVEDRGGGHHGYYGGGGYGHHDWR
jgi:hypothetical protein